MDHGDPERDGAAQSQRQPSLATRKRAAPVPPATQRAVPPSLFRHLGSGAVVDQLPPRVQAAILDQEERSEILIGWLQLAIVIIFGLLYAASPSAGGADAGMLMLEPVPLALGGYFGFTVLRLFLAYRRFMPGWLLILSIVVDMLLLMGLIWSFHLQYGQPAAFYLKAPTFMYVFIFIGLRVLRFEPRFVLTAGIVGAVGWLLMVYYAAVIDPYGNITRDYVVYMTSAREILLGAEFDKVITILIVTVILTVALSRGRRLLIDSVRDSLAARDLRRFFAADVADAIVDADTQTAAGHAVAREAAVMMIDIRGFTRFAATVPPDDVVAILTSFHKVAAPVIQQHNGIIDKFLGDGIMATFGAARPSETYAADALRAMDALLQAAARWQAGLTEDDRCRGLAVSAAVVAGPVVFCTLGDETRLEYTVIGEPANLAAKLEKHNKTTRTAALTDRPTLELATAQGYRRADTAPALGHEAGAGITGAARPVDLVVLG